jgi:NADP-dependent 3-hydroxy acid dehydrogenase YdfG
MSFVLSSLNSSYHFVLPFRQNLETITDESMTKFIEASKSMETLQSEDIANAILYAIQAPNNANVNEVLIRSTAQER